MITCPALSAPSNCTRLGSNHSSSQRQFKILISPHFYFVVINCTSLMVDPGGPLRMSSCDNHYGTQCNFSCAIGYRLNGSSSVMCVAPGNQHPGVWNNTIPRCEGKFETEITWGSYVNSANTIHNYMDVFTLSI